MKRLAKIFGYSVGAALLLGGIGLVGGFFGPILIAVLVGSDANLGPLWGIFILGPGGVIVGAIVGILIGYKKTRKT